MIEGVVIEAGVVSKMISPLIEIAVFKSGLSAIKVISPLIEGVVIEAGVVSKMISPLIEFRFVKRDSAIVIITAETKAPISVVCKTRAAHIDIRAFKIHVRFLCPCIAIVKTRLIDSDMVSCVKIERGPTAISV